MRNVLVVLVILVVAVSAVAETELAKHDRAVQQLRDALVADNSPKNMALLARELVRVPGGDPGANDLEVAQYLIKNAAAETPSDAFVAAVQAEVAVASAIGARDWKTARAALDRAKALGLSASDYANYAARIDAIAPSYLHWWKPVLIGIGVWIAAFALLLIAGAILSAVAMRAARETPSNLAENVTTLSAGVRKLYAAVLSASCVFYYASIPLVILLVIGLCAAMIYAFSVIGTYPVKIIGIIVVLAGVTIWSMLKTIFIRAEDVEPGQRLDMSTQPRLRAVLDDVAAKIGTRPVDNVYLTPATELAVTQRGKGGRERCLILGIAALDGMKVRPFKAILGHEYGHFVNRDTAGGSFALAVRRSLVATAYALAAGGAARWYNPAWQFLKAFNHVFLRISEGASRLQEVLADRWAVFAYGADAFEQGLRHVIGRSVRFDLHASATLKEVVDRKLPLANLYTYQPAENTRAEIVEGRIEDAINRDATAYDSHPTPRDRFALVHALPRHGNVSAADDDEEAWTLFDKPEALQYAMTAQVRANVATNYGIAIAAPAST